MTREELIEYLETELSHLAASWRECPRIEGNFVANAPRGGVAGLCVVTPDGRKFYLAVFEADDFGSGGVTEGRD